MLFRGKYALTPVFVGFFLFFYGCINETMPPQVSAVSPATTQNLPLEDFHLPTPDSLAIRSGSIKCGKIGHIKCGFAKAVRGKEVWNALPSLTLAWNKGKPMRYITMSTTERTSTALASSLEIYQIPLEKGNYTIKPKEFAPNDINEPEMHFSFLGNCTKYATYELDSTRHSFVRILDYDPQKKQITLRFRAYFKLISAVRDIYPDSIVFDDGIIVTKPPE